MGVGVKNHEKFADVLMDGTIDQFFICILKSVHIKKTVAQCSFLSKSLSFIIQHQLTLF